ncbi:MAG: glutaminase [Desulfuromonadales bacterium]|nr:glutaminase [Desulfuromonadales bacterium]MBN2791607.1 glutaminase [Desulfuromonadales bacterium]
MDYEKLLQDITGEIEKTHPMGQIASYIPELGQVDADLFGICLTTVKGECFSSGAHTHRFSIQSIAKVLALTLAFELEDEKLWKRVGVEPSGTPFNSLLQLEYENGIPRNPLINAGALVVCDILISRLKNPWEELVSFTRDLTGDQSIDLCPRVAQSEKISGYKNAALINLLKSCGNIHNDISAVFNFYCDLCSIEMNCRQLSQAFLFLAGGGINPLTGKTVVSISKSKRINAIMQLCGFYDEAGEFSFKVGLPGKSGVGGGIVAVLPGQYSVAVWSPRLNNKGNSYLGMKALELLTTRTCLSIF